MTGDIAAILPLVSVILAIAVAETGNTVQNSTTPAASVDACAACSYTRAGDGTSGLECLTSPFAFVHTRNLTCDYATHSCHIKAVYNSNFKTVVSFYRGCMENSKIEGDNGCIEHEYSPTCYYSCQSGLCNAERGDLYRGRYSHLYNDAGGSSDTRALSFERHCFLAGAFSLLTLVMSSL